MLHADLIRKYGIIFTPTLLHFCLYIYNHRIKIQTLTCNKINICYVYICCWLFQKCVIGLTKLFFFVAKCERVVVMGKMCKIWNWKLFYAYICNDNIHIENTALFMFGKELFFFLFQLRSMMMVMAMMIMVFVWDIWYLSKKNWLQLYIYLCTRCVKLILNSLTAKFSILVVWGLKYLVCFPSP
jgi:hypothetical protein